MTWRLDKEEAIKHLEGEIAKIRNMSNPSDDKVQLGRTMKVMLMDLMSDDE